MLRSRNTTYRSFLQISSTSSTLKKQANACPFSLLLLGDMLTSAHLHLLREGFTFTFALGNLLQCILLVPYFQLFIQPTAAILIATVKCCSTHYQTRLSMLTFIDRAYQCLPSRSITICTQTFFSVLTFTDEAHHSVLTFGDHNQ